MEQNRKHRGEWAGCSDLKHKREELLQAHKEFLEMLADGYQIKEARVKRPRIKREKKPRKVIVTLGGDWTVTMSFEEYKKYGDGLKIVMRIY